MTHAARSTTVLVVVRRQFRLRIAAASVSPEYPIRQVIESARKSRRPPASVHAEMPDVGDRYLRTAQSSLGKNQNAGPRRVHSRSFGGSSVLQIAAVSWRGPKQLDLVEPVSQNAA